MVGLLAALLYGLKYFCVWVSGGMFFVGLVYMKQSNPLCVHSIIASMFGMFVALLAASVEKTLMNQSSLRKGQS